MKEEEEEEMKYLRKRGGEERRGTRLEDDGEVGLGCAASFAAAFRSGAERRRDLVRATAAMDMDEDLIVKP